MNLEEFLQKKNIPEQMQSLGWEKKDLENITFERIKKEKKGVIDVVYTGKSYIIDFVLYQGEETKQIKRYFSKKIGPASRFIIRFASMSDNYFNK